MEFYNGELKQECVLEKINADGNKWLWVCVGSTFALYGLLGYLGHVIPEKNSKDQNTKAVIE